MPTSSNETCVLRDVTLGQGVQYWNFVNLYGCTIGDETKIGTFVEIQKNATVGARCKISSHSFVCEGVTIEDEVFVGHGVRFINDLTPRATRDDGQSQEFQARVRIDTPQEIEYYRHGGILQYVLRRLARS